MLRNSNISKIKKKNFRYRTFKKIPQAPLGTVGILGKNRGASSTQFACTGNPRVGGRRANTAARGAHRGTGRTTPQAAQMDTTAKPGGDDDAPMTDSGACTGY